MKPRTYPCIRYRHDYPDGLKINNEAEWLRVGGSGAGWVNSPAKIHDPIPKESDEKPKENVKPIDRRLGKR